MFTIPLDPTQPYFSLEIPIDGDNYRLSFYWSHRGNSWSMSLATADGDDIYTGVGLRTGLPIGFRYQHPRKPKGSFYLIDTAGDSSPKLGELQVRYKLVYDDG